MNVEQLIRICTPQPWMIRAACKDADPELFFPTPGHNATQALTICAGCPVQTECAQAGATEQFGVWGGLTPRQRRPGARHNVGGYNNGCRCLTCTTAKQAVNKARNRKKAA